MTVYLITFRSLTHAQRSARLLERRDRGRRGDAAARATLREVAVAGDLFERRGLTATVIKAPQGLSSSGCAYAVTLRSRPEEALALLRQNNMRVGRLFRRGPDGTYEEVHA